MLGKMVKVHHCPATVSGSNYSAFVTAPEQPVWEGRCVMDAASQETGSANVN